jgi:HupE/UreJ protein
MRRAAIVIALCLAAAPASAHGLRTAYLEVQEVSPGHALVHLRTNASDPQLRVASRDCNVVESDAASAYDRSWLLDCGDTLAGHTLELTGLGAIVAEAVAAIAFSDGQTATQLVQPSSPVIELRPSTASAVEVAGEFVGLGLHHIATGYDHLLFLLLLVLLLREVRAVLIAETAFTLSHSLAFSATALRWIHVSAAAAEACIALSLVFLAADIRTRAAAVRWRGPLLALGFGFVHGLGFAGGLREIGLPEHAIGAALIGFGAGIELGQIAFLAGVLAVAHLLRHSALRARLELPALYAVGGTATYWFLERLAVL